MRADRDPWFYSFDKTIKEELMKGNEKNARDQIKKRILDGYSYPLKNDSLKLNLITTPDVPLSNFNPNIENYLLYFLTVLTSHSNIMIPMCVNCGLDIKEEYNELVKGFPTENLPYTEYRVNKIVRSLVKTYINHYPYLADHLVIWCGSKNKCFISPRLATYLKICNENPSYDLYVLKLSIVGNGNNHSNMIIVDPKRKEVERFDPYGQVPYISSDDLDAYLKKYFVRALPGYKYIPSGEIFDGLGYQIVSNENNDNARVLNDPAGFCIAWCLWYVEMRALNYHISSREMNREAMQKLNRIHISFRDYIRNYSAVLESRRERILKLLRISPRLFYSDYWPDEIEKKYFKMVRKVFHKVLNKKYLPEVEPELDINKSLDESPDVMLNLEKE